MDANNAAAIASHVKQKVAKFLGLPLVQQQQM
jgi:hypothetical protein